MCRARDGDAQGAGRSYGQRLDHGVCLVGPHRDRLELSIGGLPAHGYASHGGLWSLALALRLASFSLLRQGREDPVLILDDVFASLTPATGTGWPRWSPAVSGPDHRRGARRRPRDAHGHPVHRPAGVVTGDGWGPGRPGPGAAGGRGARRGAGGRAGQGRSAGRPGAPAGVG